MASSGVRRLELAVLILALGAILLAALILIPMGWLAYVSLGGLQGGVTLANYVALVSTPDMLRPLLLSLGVAFAVAAICAVVASPMAWLVARTDLPWKRGFRRRERAETPPKLRKIKVGAPARCEVSASGTRETKGALLRFSARAKN